MTPETSSTSILSPLDRRRGPTIGSAALALVAILGIVPALPAQGQPSPVRVQPVELAEVEDLALVTGDLRAVQRSALASQEAGLVIELPVREGMRVAKGDVIARLDPTRLAAERDSLVALRAAADAEREQRVAELAMKRLDVESLTDLSKRNVINSKELADARSEEKITEAQLARAVANLADADARLALIDRRLADLEIRAPFAGTVVARHIDLGEWITPGTATVELVSTGSVEVWLNVSEKYRRSLAAAIADGNGGLEVKIDAVGRTFSAPSPRVIPNVDPVSRNFPVVVEIADPEGVLIPGMSASAYIPTGRGGEHLLVSKDAILRGPTGPYVLVAMQLDPAKPHQAVPMQVRILFPTGESVAVDSPSLFPGAPAIVEGNERLFPMMNVALPKSEAAADSGTAGAPGAEGGTDR